MIRHPTFKVRIMSCVASFERNKHATSSSSNHSYVFPSFVFELLTFKREVEERGSVRKRSLPIYVDFYLILYSINCVCNLYYYLLSL